MKFLSVVLCFMASLTSAHCRTRTLVKRKILSLWGKDTYAAFTLSEHFFTSNPHAIGLHHLVGMDLRSCSDCMLMSNEESSPMWKSDKKTSWATLFQHGWGFSKPQAISLADTCQVTNRPDENGRKSRVCWFCFGQCALLPSSMVGPASQPWSQVVIEIMENMKDSSTSDLLSSSGDKNGFPTKTPPLNKSHRGILVPF